jgi:hypothetical protein
VWASSADYDELVASFLQFFEGVCVFDESVGGIGLREEASSEADGDFHGSGVGFVYIYVVGWDGERF